MKESVNITNETTLDIYFKSSPVTGVKMIAAPATVTGEGAEQKTTVASEPLIVAEEDPENPITSVADDTDNELAVTTTNFGSIQDIR